MLLSDAVFVDVVCLSVCLVFIPVWYNLSFSNRRQVSIIVNLQGKYGIGNALSC